MRLLDLAFSDLFVGPNRDWTWYRVTSNARECVSLPDQMDGEVGEFRTHLLQAIGEDPDTRIQWQGETLRVRRQSVDNGVVMFVVRRFNVDEYSMDKIGVQAAVIRELRADHSFLRTGAIGVFGPPGGGKSSTALSFVLDRLREHGGTAWRIGCPIETPMQGKHGKGWLYELEVKRDEEIGGELRGLYRTVPNIVLIEEVRDAQTAREVVRAAGSGYLVVFTFHGNDLSSAIGQFVRLAAGDDLEQTASRVADFLRVALYVELHSVPVGLTVKNTSFVSDERGRKTALSAQPLFFTEKDSGLRSMVRNGEYHKLGNEMSRQRRMLMAGESLVGEAG
jgi:Tfp pilus assembly ATPase PilU